VALGELVAVKTKLRTGRESASGATVYFYDGDPDAGGRLFDVERVPHIRARDRYQISVLFRSDRCGEHELFAVVEAGTVFEQVATTSMHVACDESSRQ
jgi:hypothetical protein